MMTLEKAFDMAKTYPVSEQQKVINFVVSIKPEQPISKDKQNDEQAERKKAAGKKAWRALESMRQQVAETGLPELTLDEINAEIAEVRKERKARRAAAQ